MSLTHALDDDAVERLAAFASRFTGFSRDAILPDAIRRAALGLMRARGVPQEVLLGEALQGSRSVIHALCQAVSVGETFFFRHPEHFRYLAGTLLPELLESGRTVVRAWSAGCATGEETYSIAACLLDTMPWHRTASVSVLGTDLLARNLETARAGSYGLWSRRPSGPLLHPVFHAESGDRVTVDDRIRAATSFREHNLLSPIDEQFDVIFCRNVLVYFSQEAVKTVVAHLSAALAPGGAVFFGSMDLAGPPPGLAANGLPELQIFRKPEPPLPKKARVAVPPLKTPPYVARVPSFEPIALHLRALVHIERGEKKIAAGMLAELLKRVPDYLPGVLERALLHVRQGERTAATTLMRDVLRRSEKLPPEALVSGPEPLPASFYRDSARTFLGAFE
jgi:chemotaxis methyl-accepting protein methylase